MWFHISGFLLILAEVHPFVEQQLMGRDGKEWSRKQTWGRGWGYGINT